MHACVTVTDRKQRSKAIQKETVNTTQYPYRRLALYVFVERIHEIKEVRTIGAIINVSIYLTTFK